MVPCRRCPSAYHLACMPPGLHPDKSMPDKPRRVWIAHRNPDGGSLFRNASCSYAGLVHQAAWTCRQCEHTSTTSCRNDMQLL